MDVPSVCQRKLGKVNVRVDKVGQFPYMAATALGMCPE